MPRGIKLFGWLFVYRRQRCCCWAWRRMPSRPRSVCHVAMGVDFGGLHLAYGIYLYFTEPKHAA